RRCIPANYRNEEGIQAYWIAHILNSLDLLQLVANFNAIDAGVVFHRNERKHDLSLRIGRDSVKVFFYGAVRASGGAKDIKVPQQCDAVQVHIKDAAIHTSAGGASGAEPGLGKIEPHRVPSCRDRDRVPEMAVSLASVEIRSFRAGHSLVAKHGLPAVVVAVRQPHGPGTICI